jgi:hypothetical protein
MVPKIYSENQCKSPSNGNEKKKLKHSVYILVSSSQNSVLYHVSRNLKAIKPITNQKELILTAYKICTEFLNGLLKNRNKTDNAAELRNIGTYLYKVRCK